MSLKTDAQACASDAQGPGGSTATEVLTILCAGRSYAIDIMAVREIRSWSEPTPLPHAPPHLLGMLNLRGSVIPVIDLAQRLGEGRTKDDKRHVIVIIQKGDAIQGLLVDAVCDIVSPSADMVQDLPNLVAEIGSMAESLLVLEGGLVQKLVLEDILHTVDGTMS
jgi:purine-binding chemotaxis protein CheW